ncbi:MAG TPA: histidine kinase dimerization/phosphoacceptor domain -containing protein [Rectinemataceae bacterium]|nr:histidine kinase dimerization/phosphoacceptor domain -containing protein [Rectinemataceae bacterium]
MDKARRQTILLVEDETLIAMMEKTQLEGLGYAVIHVTRGEEAVELACRGDEVDLVLMDIDLGAGIDGTVAAQEILECRELPILFLSSHLEKEVVDKTDKTSFYGYVVKNSNFNVLRASIRMALRLSEADATIRKELAERRAVEAELLKSKERYQKDERIGHLGNWELDIATGRVWVSDEARRIFGFDAESKDFSREDLASCITDRERVARALEGMAAGDQPYSLEFEVRPRDGSEPRIIWSDAELVRDAQGRPAQVSGVIQDITTRKRSEQRIQALLEEKELLLKDVHHRVKNNMNTIYSLLSVQADRQADPGARQVLLDAAERVESMEILYDKLYSSPNPASLSLRDYLPALVQEIVGVFPERARLRVVTSVEDIEVGAKLISNLGFIVNELVTNSMKYAFAEGEDGLVSLRVWRLAGDRVALRIEDSGPGLPETVSLEDSPGFGLQLVGLLVKQIGGTVAVGRGKGTSFLIEFGA